MSKSTFNDSSVGTVGSRVVVYSRQYKRTNERKGTSYSTNMLELQYLSPQKEQCDLQQTRRLLLFLFLIPSVVS
jgi:hypothetical protein